MPRAGARAAIKRTDKEAMPIKRVADKGVL